MKYICFDCDDPCVLEIAMDADRIPDTCPWDLICDRGKRTAWKKMEENNDIQK